LSPAALLLDTHIALWLDSGNARLRPATVQLIDRCRQRGGTILLSAVSAWEIALLVDTGRIQLDVPVSEWLERFCERPGVARLELSLEAAGNAYRLHPFEHRDPGDRLLIASAMAASAPLVTYDERILAFADRHGKQIRFAAAA
jgi:PIN domain nuclease of toxin-antitoxin system